MAKRVNITIPEAQHELLKQAAEELYEGNFSRFLADAGLFYAGVLRERLEKDCPGKGELEGVDS